MSRRFVILLHEAPVSAERATHWDLMLEFGDTLRTWALADEPKCDSEVDAEILPDHRLAYLEYEGPISRNRGVVTRVEAGTYSIIRHDEQTLAVTLSGENLRCDVEIASLDSKRAQVTFGEQG